MNEDTEDSDKEVKNKEKDLRKKYLKETPSLQKEEPKRKRGNGKNSATKQPLNKKQTK